MEAAGIEPASDVSQPVGDKELSDTGTTRAANALHDSGTDWLDLSQIDNDLKELIEVWAQLPVPIKAALRTLARSGIEEEKGVKSVMVSWAVSLVSHVVESSTQAVIASRLLLSTVPSRTGHRD